MKKILFVFLLLCINQIKAQVCFSTATNYTIGTNVLSKNITTGDFNGDGKIDLAIAAPHATTVTASEVSILLGNGSGGFGAANVFTTVDQPYGICSADFNGDNKTDIAIAVNGTTLQGFSIMLGNGAGGLGASTYSVATGSNPAAIVTADFNADGKKDIAVTNFNATPATAFPIYLGNGNGTFTLHSTVTIGSGTVSIHPGKVVCADVNSDNKLDFLIACEDAGNKMYVCLGNGAGAVSSSTYYTVGTGGAYNSMGIATTDFNGDGHADVVTANGSTNDVTVLLNSSTGTGAFTVNHYGAGNNPQAAVCADFDGDGDIDIAVANTSANQVSILINNGAGVFNVPTTATAFGVAINPVELVSADFDGNGKPDLATANNSASSGNTSVLLNSLPGAISISGVNTICTGSNTTLTASGTSSYTWSANAGSAVSNTVNVSPTSNTSYTVTGTNTTCTVTATKTATVTVNQLPVINIVASPTFICNGNPITLTAYGASTYTWSNGITNGVAFTPTIVATYTVTGTDVNNCTNTNTIYAGIPTPEIPNICLVTTDSASFYNYNFIYWDKSQYTNVDSFIVYRYVSNVNNYLRIGAVSRDSSRFIDTARHIPTIGTHGGDPNYTTYRYTLAIRDTCGNIGAQSPRHETVFLQDQHNGNFNITPYVIGAGQTNPVTGYDLYVDITGTGNNFSYLTSVTGTSATDPGYSSAYVYRIDILGFNCVYNQRLAGGNNNLSIRAKSHSNTSRVAQTTGLNNVVNTNLVSVYPNPNNGTFVVETSITEKQNLQIFDVNGKLVLSQIINGKTQIDNTNLIEGVYSVTIISKQVILNKKLVIVK
jgi:hypothetical protein